MVYNWLALRESVLVTTITSGLPQSMHSFDFTITLRMVTGNSKFGNIKGREEFVKVKGF